MLSVVVATQESERTLLPTLAALVPGAAANVVREVIIADAGSRDGTSIIADGAGCEVIVSDAPLGGRLKDAAARAKGPWLLFLQPGVSPDVTWVAEVARFIEEAELQGVHGERAAIFRKAAPMHSRSPLAEAFALLIAALGSKPAPEQGLLIHRSLYNQLGGHRSDSADAEADMLARVGRKRLAMLRTGAVKAR